MFYVNPAAIAALYDDLFSYGRLAGEAQYSFTDSMRPFVQGPFSDEAPYLPISPHISPYLRR